RRTSFYGLALPQLAATGVACGFAVMPWWVEHVGIGGLELQAAMEDTHAAMNYHLGWATLFTLGGLGLLLLWGRRSGSEVAHVAAAFVVASAATVLFAHASPMGEIFVHELLRGEILAVGIHELETLAGVLGGTFFLLWWLQNDFLLVSYDRESAQVLGKRVRLLEAGLLLLVGACVAAGTMTVGPVVLFGLLVLPPIAARPFARSMPGFLWLASAFGSAGSAAGIWGSFHWDLPLGPCVVLACAVATLPGWIVQTLRR
ncbi:MAG: metal ABC transporter permease, partial [Planctomycetes bacterium]|nr:metal ABC transporter permease [Planctomycetota bacterium]